MGLAVGSGFDSVGLSCEVGEAKGSEGGRAQAPTGPRARPREAGHLGADFSQEDQRAKGSTAQVKSRDRGRGAWAMGQRGRPASLTRGRKGGRRAIGSGYRREGDGRAEAIGPGYRTGAGGKGAGRPREGAQISLNKCSPKFCSVGGGPALPRRKSTEQIFT